MARFTKDNTKLSANGDGTYELEVSSGIDKGDTLGSIMPMGLARRYLKGADALPREGWAWQHPKDGTPQHAPTRSGAVEALCSAWEGL